MRSISYDIEFDLDSFLIDLRSRAANRRKSKSTSDSVASSNWRSENGIRQREEPAPQR